MRYEAKKGDRIRRYFWAVTLTKITDDNLWWNSDDRRWEAYCSTKGARYSTHAPCRTLRAYKRMLRKFPEIKGISCLVNKYKGYDIYSCPIGE